MFDDPAEDYEVNLSSAESVNSVLMQRRVREEQKVAQKLESDNQSHREREIRTRKLKNEASKRRFKNMFKKIGAWFSRMLFYLVSFFISDYWFERDRETQRTNFQIKLTKISMNHGKKIAFISSVLIVIFFVWSVWKVGFLFGLWGVTPLADVYYEGSMKIQNTWIPEWVEPDLFQRIHARPLIRITEEDLIGRFVEQEVDGVAYNVSFGRLAEAMRAKSREASCIAAIHLGVRFPIYQVGKYWFVNPSPTFVSKKKWNAAVVDKYLGERDVESPYSAKIIFDTQTGVKGRVELTPLECGCIAALTSITGRNGESLFSQHYE